MPIPGPAVHRQLIEAYEEAKARLNTARGEVSAVEQQRDDLDEDRSDALVDLAEHYLPSLTREAIQQTWSEVRATIFNILLRKEDAQRRISEQVSQYALKRQSLESELIDAGQRLDEAIEEQERLASEAEQILKSDESFIALSDRAAVAEAALERAEANLAEIEQDSARKLPAYDESALFRYLYDRGFGTEQYKHRGFTRRMDRWVAKLTDYSKARQSYEFLRRTPATMQKIIANDRADLETVMDELARHRDQAAAKVGLPAQIEKVTAAKEARDKLVAELDTLRQESDRAEHQLSELADPRGSYYREAIQVFRDMLDRFAVSDLEHRAHQTIDITDDQIVARLQGIHARIDDLADHARDRHQRIRQLQGYLDGFGNLIQRYRAAGFDSGRAVFVDGFDIYALLANADSERDLEDVWQQIRQAQRWGPSAMDRVTEIATHPMTQVLVNAMAHAAAGAMREHARNAGRRYNTRVHRFPQQGPWSGGVWIGGGRGR